MELQSLDEIRHATAGLASGNTDALDRLVWTGVFGAEAERRDAARAAVLEQARSAGLYPASIQGLYMARGRGEVPHNFTVPAVNIRGMAYLTARALFRARRALDAGAVICEIARSEISYTDQRPAEYTFVILAAALREGWKGPVFLQGDHFQINAKKYAGDPESELNAVKQLTVEAIQSGFYNIDVDTSTLVDLSQGTLDEQQELNGRLCAEITSLIRGTEPSGVTVSVGGEIGEVGGKNSTPEEFEAFMRVYQKALAGIAPGVPGISKISIQTGTSHGGVPLPDGSVARVQVDFDALERISALARERYGLGGAVQHGASTLPAELFDHPAFPAALKQEMYEKLRTLAADERKSADTDEQFFYKTRKKALGPFKSEMWGIPAAAREAIGESLEKKFRFLLEKLGVPGTRAIAEQHAPFVPGSFPATAAMSPAHRAHEDVTGLHD